MAVVRSCLKKQAVLKATTEIAHDMIDLDSSPKRRLKQIRIGGRQAVPPGACAETRQTGAAGRKALLGPCRNSRREPGHPSLGSSGKGVQPQTLALGARPACSGKGMAATYLDDKRASRIRKRFTNVGLARPETRPTLQGRNDPSSGAPERRAQGPIGQSGGLIAPILARGIAIAWIRRGTAGA